MENAKAIEVINIFFRDKIENFISAECQKILSEAKKGKLKTEIENISKQEDAIEYNQSVKDKLRRLAFLLTEKSESVAVAQVEVSHALMLFECRRYPDRPQK